MSTIHTSESQFDPKFVPPAAALKIVGLTVAQVKTDDDLFNLISSNTSTIGRLDDQIAVAIYIFHQRGWKYEDLTSKTGMPERTLKRKNVEGMAILRTKEITRTVSAIRAGELSKKVVDDITSSTDSADVKIRKLEEAAVGAALKSYVTEEGKPADSVVKADVMHARLTQVVEEQIKPVQGWNLVNAIPLLAGETGLKIKESKRSSQNNGGSNNPMGLEYNLTKALTDMQAIEKAAEEQYIPTTQDIFALLRLVEAVQERLPDGALEYMVLDQDLIDALLEMEEAK